MDLSLSQLPKRIGAGPMFVYEPGSVGDERIVTKKAKAVSRVKKVKAAAKIRVITVPAIAKKSIDASIAKHTMMNQAKAMKLMKAIGVKFKPRKPATSGAWGWFTGAGKLSDLSKYSTAQRERLKAFIKAESIGVIEKTFSQSELDQILAKIRQGAKAPAEIPPLVDPYRAASQEYQAVAGRSMASLGAEAIKAGTDAAKVVGDEIVNTYRIEESTGGGVSEWFDKSKWALGAAVLLIGGFVLWPKIQPYVSTGSSVGTKLNALRNLFGGKA